jgi:hypothetical protein
VANPRTQTFSTRKYSAAKRQSSKAAEQQNCEKRERKSVNGQGGTDKGQEERAVRMGGIKTVIEIVPKTNQNSADQD